MTEDEMVGWHHQLNGHEFEQAPEVDDGQGGLVCCSPWGGKESDTTEQLNLTELRIWRYKAEKRGMGLKPREGSLVIKHFNPMKTVNY